MPLNLKVTAAAFSALFLLPSLALATLYLPANDAVSLTADVSNHELSRISIEGARVVNVRYLDGELDLQKDEDAGQVYFRPTSKKKINIFVTSESGKTYLIVLNPVAGKGADSIVIQEKTAILQQIKQQQKLPQDKPYLTKDNSYVAAIKAFIISIANNNTADLDITSKEEYAEIPLWREVLFIHSKTYQSEDLSAKAYQLTNVSKNPINLEEAEFFKHNVLAVSIQKHSLAPGEMTQVLVVSAKNGEN